MWQAPKRIIEDIFFKDKIDLFELTFTENDIGESIEATNFVGTYPCNVQNGQSGLKSTETGESSPQSLRISTLKEIPLSYEKTYKLKIAQARIGHTNEMFNIDGWTEAQISTVISASREVAV